MNKLPITASDLAGQIAVATAALDVLDGAIFLKLHKGGFFVYGSDDTEVEEESEWAINPASFAIGFIAWADDEAATGPPLGEEMRGIAQGPILKSDLPAVEDGTWSQQVGMQLMCVSGEDVGTEVLFKSSSKGGVAGFNSLLNQVLTHLKSNADTKQVVPIVELEVISYKHPNAKFGMIYKPVFTVRKWATMDEMPESESEGADESGDEEETPPEKKKVLAPPDKKKTEPEQEPDPIPKKRRRRRSGK